MTELSRSTEIVQLRTQVLPPNVDRGRGRCHHPVSFCSETRPWVQDVVRCSGLCQDETSRWFDGVHCQLLGWWPVRCRKVGDKCCRHSRGKADSMVPCPAFCPNLFVENTRARPTRRAEGDPFQCRERAGRAQGGPREPHPAGLDARPRAARPTLPRPFIESRP